MARTWGAIAAGAAAVGDAIARWWYLPGSKGTGTATWNLDSGKVTARVRVEGPGGATATLRMAWNDKGRHPSATVTGRAKGKPLAATLPAP